jgi:hypothetical protein
VIKKPGRLVINIILPAKHLHRHEVSILLRVSAGQSYMGNSISLISQIKLDTLCNGTLFLRGKNFSY